MLSADGFLKALAAVIAGAFACVVWLGGPRRAPHAWLSTFLLLISINQGAEALRAVVADAGARVMLFRIASVAAALDPAALVLFAAASPGGQPLSRLRVVVPLLAVSGALAVVAGWTLLEPTDTGPDVPFRFALALYTLVAYGAVLGWAASGAREGVPVVAWRPLGLGLAVVAVPAGLRVVDEALLLFAWPRLLDPVGLGADSAFWMLYAIVESLAVLALAAAGAWVARVAWRAGARAAVLTGVVIAVGLLVLRLHEVSIVLSILGAAPRIDLQTLGRSGAPARWLAFGAFLSVAVLRHGSMELAPRSRLLSARLLVGAAALALFGVAFALVAAATSTQGEQVPPLLWGGLLAAVGLSQGFRALVDAVMRRVYGLDARAGAAQAGPLLLGRRVADRYRLASMLGRGASGRAFLARDEVLRRDVVLKEVRSVGTEEDAMREARLAGSVRHPNVLTVHDAIPCAGSTLLVTEHAPAGTLAERLARGPIPRGEALAILSGVVDGLAAVHAAGIVHRDLTPANILMMDPVTPKIADFGIAALVAGRTAGVGDAPLFVGTRGHMAPEQERGEAATAAADVYAVGLLARSLLPAGMPTSLQPVVARALAQEPRDRFPDAGLLRDALAAALAKAHDQ